MNGIKLFKLLQRAFKNANKQIQCVVTTILRSLLWHRFGKMLSLNSFEISQLVETMVHNIDIMIIMVARELHG